jgi:hypothetical protein
MLVWRYGEETKIYSWNHWSIDNFPVRYCLFCQASWDLDSLSNCWWVGHNASQIHMDLAKTLLAYGHPFILRTFFSTDFSNYLHFVNTLLKYIIGLLQYKFIRSIITFINNKVSIIFLFNMQKEANFATSYDSPPPSRKKEPKNPSNVRRSSGSNHFENQKRP